MKIVILVHNLTGGGAERVAALLANGFAERGDQVVVVVQAARKEVTYNVSDMVTLKSIVFPIKNKLLYSVFSKLNIVREYYLWKLNKFLHSFLPDVCIGVMEPYIRDIFTLTRDIGTHVIQTYHSSFELPPNAEPRRIRDVEKSLKMDGIIKTKTVLTHADKLFIGSRMSDVYVMPNPLTFNPVEIIPYKEKIILSCGRLDAWYVKGFDLLINAWGLVAKKYPEWKLQIVGTGKKKSRCYLESIVNKNNLEGQMSFLGYRDDVVELYKKAEIFVLSSRYEGFGMVLLEAMSQGCACIACDYKGRQREIIENEDQGIICETDSAFTLALSIERMILDNEYRKKCQLNAINRSYFFSIEETIKRWDMLFNEIGIKKNDIN